MTTEIGTNVISFNNDGLHIDAYESGGVVYLNLEQAARGLGFTQMKNGVEYVKWERVNGYLEDFGFSPQVGKDAYIPENVFYRLAMKAKNPVAERFQAWIADEVIPAIRKHGMYMTEDVENLMFTDPRKFAELALRFADERDKRREAERQLALQAPKVEKHDQLMSADGGILCGDMSKMLERNGHKWLNFPNGTRKKMGQNNFMLWLRVMNYICSAHGERYNTPKQKWVERGYFILKENAVDMGGSNRVTLTPLVTPAGQSYFLDLFQKGETTNA